MTFPLIITVPVGTSLDEIKSLHQSGWHVITTDRPDLVKIITPTAEGDSGALLNAAMHALATPAFPGVTDEGKAQNLMLARVHERFMSELNRQLKPKPTTGEKKP